MSIQFTPSSSARWIGGDRLVVVLRSPPELPPAAPDRPGAEADPGDLQAGGTELSRPQRPRHHSLPVVDVPDDTKAIKLNV